MKTIGIIAEFNPFHRGHEYLIREAKKQTGAQYCIAAMSGYYVQRGEPAVLDKYTRTRMALAGGADLVVELPCAFATCAAPDFASAGVRLIAALGADFLAFGSESGDIGALKRTAEALGAESEEISAMLRSQMKSGSTYAVSLSRALSAKADGTGPAAGSNDILAAEYLKALSAIGSPFTPAAVKRVGEAYNSGTAPDPEGFASASAIRKLFLDGRESEASRYIPRACLPLPANAEGRSVFVRTGDFSDMLKAALIRCGDPASYCGISTALAARIRRLSPDPCTYDELVGLLRTRSIQASTVSRGLLHILLGYTARQHDSFQQDGYALYARILGFRRESLPLLHQIKKNASVPLITKVADASSLLSPNGNAMLDLEIRGSLLYRQAVYTRSRLLLPDEYRAGPVIL